MAAEMMYTSAWAPGPIPIVDRVAPTLKLRPETQTRWREALLYALMYWSRTGLEFDLFEAPRAKNMNDQYFYRDYAEPGEIQLVQWGSRHAFEEKTLEGTYRYPPAFAYVDTWTDPDRTAGVCGFSKRRIRKASRYYMRYLIGHEIGHSLGLGHGTEGIMGRLEQKPSDAEVALLRSYYGVA
jgi:hypothetical protein